MPGDGQRRLEQRPVVLDHALQRLEAEVEAVEEGVAPLEGGDDPEGLEIVVEAAEGRQRLGQRRLAGMAEGAVAEIVSQRHGLGQVLVDGQGASQGPGDLRHLERVGEAGAEMVALEIDQHLGLVFEPAEGGGMDDPIAIPLERAAQRARRLLDRPAEPAAHAAGKGRQHHAGHARLRPTVPDERAVRLFDKVSGLPK